MNQLYKQAKSPYKEAQIIENQYQCQNQLKNYYHNVLNHKFDYLTQLKKYQAQLEKDVAQAKLMLQDRSSFSKSNIGSQMQYDKCNYYTPKYLINYPLVDIQKQTIIKKPSNKQYLIFLKREKLPFNYNLIQKKDDGKNNQKPEDTINKLDEQNQNIEINNQEININNNEIPQQINQDEQQEEPYKLIRKFESNQVRLQKTINIIKQLQNISSNKRNMEEGYKYYLREIGDFNTLCKHYSIQKLKIKQNLKQHCNKIQFVRGDGNCFYTAFIYQFFIHLLFTYNLNQYDQFIQFVLDKKIQFKINYDDFQIDDQELLEEFLYQLQQLRLIENKEDRKQQLLSQFIQYQISENGQGCFYNLSTIFLRNLCDTLLELSEMKDQCLDRQNLLIWEAECNYNEIIVQTLASQLKIHIKLIFFYNEEFIIQDYEKDCPNQIILLIQPGHYNIGYND